MKSQAKFFIGSNMTNRLRAAGWITTLVVFLVGLECRQGLADTVSVDPLQLTPQSSNANPEPFFGNWFSTFEHASGLIRADGGFTQIPYLVNVQNPPPPAIIPSEVFYVAFAWDYNFTTPSGNEVYGWAKLQVAPPLPPSPGNPLGSFNPDLILLASATTTDDRGIVVGEYRVVPEPASLACASVGLLGLSLARRGLTARRTQSPSPSSRRQ
jgi:hypothetical protein